MKMTDLSQCLETVQVSSPKESFGSLRKEILEAIRDCLDGGRYILGEQVANFERDFASFVGVDFAIGVANGTDALRIALWAAVVGEDDAVLTVSQTAVATVAAIHLAGAHPVLVDIDPDTFTIDVNRVEDTLKHHAAWNIKAIIPVHLYGHPARLRDVTEIASRYNIAVIEDCAQAHGAEYERKRVGSFGLAGAFSFYPTKNLGALGDGGAIVTNDPDFAKKAKMLRQYGWERRYISKIAGMNSRLDEIQAAVLQVKLPRLEAANAARRQIADHYRSRLSLAGIANPREIGPAKHVYHQYVIRVQHRDQLREYLSSQGIETAISYPAPVHLQEGYRGLARIGYGGLGITERIVGEILSLPMYPELSLQNASRVVESIVEWAKAH